MILTKNENGDVTTTLYESTNIIGSHFNNVTKDLIVIFNGGKQYQYSGVKLTDYYKFDSAESQGKALAAYIKPYPFTKLADTNIELLKEEITKAKTSQLEEKNKFINDKLTESLKKAYDAMTGGFKLSSETVVELNTLLDAHLTIK
jgi:hypothetical protein